MPEYDIIDKNITFYEWAPKVFSRLRFMDGYDYQSINKSLKVTIQANVDQMRKAGEGMGKSGSFFFQSHDAEFLIKTMT